MEQLRFAPRDSNTADADVRVLLEEDLERAKQEAERYG
jgi:hypothetical protein